ncbi:hypothetical protein AVEN_23071-1 [Araneus ventricosus]|uniref:Uncharacterized protein n=1 Tax=Araneus ventricosus TaxID=182803 RepID=A0A4Y2IQ59_ARAVE|nr:hypothetical protein AVEN_23071-1 [Araneus ventricosus]
MGVEMDNNNINELVAEHSQDLNTEELMELHCVSLQEVLEESLSEEKEVTAKQQSFGAMRAGVVPEGARVPLSGMLCPPPIGENFCTGYSNVIDK